MSCSESTTKPNRRKGDNKVLANLRTEMYKRKITSKAISKYINRSEKAVSNKIHEKCDFTRSEMFLIKSNFFPDFSLDYLFESDNTTS